jgi:hypothetical protein
MDKGHRKADIGTRLEPDRLRRHPPVPRLRHPARRLTWLHDPAIRKVGPRRIWSVMMGFAYDTPIMSPSGEIAIQNLQKGDRVMAASLSEGGAPSWAETAVAYSDGVDRGRHATMIYIDFGFDDPGRLICDQEQLFLDSEGLLVPANRLDRGRSLRRPDGSERVIGSVSLGEYTGGVHGFATGLEYRGSPDTHLIAAGGVIAGDFLLEMNQRGRRGQAGPRPEGEGGEAD